jgi:iron complex outermembrane receptor protein
MHHRLTTLACLALSAVMAYPATGAPITGAPVAEQDAGRYFDMDLQALMDVDVTSVAGVAQSWFSTPAAMYVITSDDMRRAGARQLPEALRLVPGIHVSREGSRHWAVSSRGFHDRLTDKLQVLMDGRVIYDPMFAGVMWDVQDMLAEDLDRIEVVRGPGATLWGANAVNGVINIESRSAKDTQGGYVSTGTSTVERYFGEARYGGKLADNAWYRVWAKYADHEEFPSLGGPARDDDWGLLSGGMRVDIEGEQANLTIIGGGHYSDRMGESTRVPVPGAHMTFAAVRDDGAASGAHLLGRVTGRLDHGGWTLQAYYDRTDRRIYSGLEVVRDTVDVDLRHNWRWHPTNELVWGVAWRLTSDKSKRSSFIQFNPTDRTTDTVSGFLQNTWTIIPDRLFLMAGTKLEHNDYTGFEVQPTGRLWWTPNRKHTVWASFSRALRTPSRLNSEVTYIGAYVDTGLAGGGPPSGVFVPVTLTGSQSLKSETLLAYEVGYRNHSCKKVTLDVTAFINEHRAAMTYDTGNLGRIGNMAEALSIGAETALTWQVADNWRLTGSYSFIEVESSPDNTDANGNTPHHRVTLRSELDITPDLELNTALYYVDQNPDDRAFDTNHLRLDLGVTWRPTDNLELAVWGQNLLDSRHYEGRYGLLEPAAGEVPRSFSVQLTYRF